MDAWPPPPKNSLRYRLARIETLLGRSLRDFATLVDLHLATLARDATRVFDHDGEGRSAGGRSGHRGQDA
jgi:hypothetical protein